MKIAILSDIHGNVTALEAVLADLKTEQPAEHWILGDFLMPGTGRKDLLSSLQTLENPLYLRGNWEDTLLTAQDRPQNTAENIYLARMAQYQHRELEDKDLKFLQSLPLSHAFSLGYLKILICHNLPHKNSGKELHHASREELKSQLLDTDVDIALFGHTHKQRLEHYDDGKIILNPGSIGLNYGKPGYADYALLEIGGQQPKVTLKSVPYYMEKEIELAFLVGLPYPEVHEERLRHGKTPKVEELKAKLCSL
ncbi:MAG: metallophosphatase family protein [Turicibacter sp.]|nr:metallophosphatase family protein [Turicibacter sp.]